eukprot:scaffold3608_cov116-Pinguiococcus_pyrenoidosus.AAC.1
MVATNHGHGGESACSVIVGLKAGRESEFSNWDQWGDGKEGMSCSEWLMDLKNARSGCARCTWIG